MCGFIGEGALLVAFASASGQHRTGSICACKHVILRISRQHWLEGTGDSQRG